ncbi:hypothetical protein D3C87_1463780 [compost metagenome]
MPALGQGLADAAHADDAQGLAVYVTAEMCGADVAGPLAVANHVRQFHHAPRSGQDQCETGVGGGFGEHVRRVAEQDAPLGKVIDVVVVDAHRNAGDGFKVGRQIEQFGIEFQAGAEQAVGTGQGVAQFAEAFGIEAVDQCHVGVLMQASHEQRREFLVQDDLLFHLHDLNFNSGMGCEGTR